MHVKFNCSDLKKPKGMTTQFGAQESHNTGDAQNFSLTFPVDFVPFQMQK